MSYPNVFIGTPTHACKRYCAGEFVEAVLKNAPGAEFYVACNSEKCVRDDYRVSGYNHVAHMMSDKCYDTAEAVHARIADTCNLLREWFLRSECDLYLSLESDVILAPDTLPRMIAAISDEYPVVYANCYRWPGGRPFLEHKVAGETDRVTMGCTLIERKVLEVISFRYDPNLLGAFPDAHFAFDCRAKGFKMWYDPEIWVEHLEDPRGTGVGSNKRGWDKLPESEKWWRAKK